MTKLAIHPLTPDRWDDLVALFETDSITRICWCVLSRMTPAEIRETPPPERRKRFGSLVEKGPPPGLIAYKDDEPVGWVAIAPRSATPQWNVGRKSSAVEKEEDAADPQVWAATCFFVRSGHRKQGMTADLLEAAIAWAKKHGAARLEACPMSHDDKRSNVGLYVGPKRVFERRGFDTVLERKPGRPLMRLKLKAAAKKTTAPKKKPATAKKAARTKARAR
jgi:GNAT superfamily N-acetyltransferase